MSQSAFGALRHRDLAIYETGNFISNFGTWFQNIAQALLVYRLTDGNTFWVGVVGFGQFAAVGLLAPWSGSAADRFDRTHLIMATQIGSMAATLVLAALAAAEAATVATVVVIALLLGVGNAFSAPAAKALVPGLVPREMMGKAIALDSVTFNLSRALGPLGGAYVVARHGVAWAFVANAFSYLPLVIALLLLKAPRSERRTGTGMAMRETLRMLRGRPRLLGALMVTASVSMASDPVPTLGPAFSTEVYGRPDTFAGVLVGLFGAGAVVAAVTVSPLLQSPERRVAVLMTIMAVGLAGMAASSSPWVALVSVGVTGFAYFGANTQATTILQLGVDDAHRGRASVVWSIAFLGTKPVASLFLGALAVVVGPRLATASMVVLLIAAIGGSARLFAAARAAETATAVAP